MIFIVIKENRIIEGKNDKKRACIYLARCRVIKAGTSARTLNAQHGVEVNRQQKFQKPAAS